MDRRSHEGHLIFLDHNLIRWKSGKQPIVSRSSTEAKYRSLADAATELNWTASTIKEMGITLNFPQKLAYDNLGANYHARNPIHHGKAKHIAISYHFIQKYVSSGQLIVEHVQSEDQPTDILTKPLPTTAFTNMRDNLICELPMSLREGVSMSNQNISSKDSVS